MLIFFFSSRRRHTRCALVTGVQTCALPILVMAPPHLAQWIRPVSSVGPLMTRAGMTLGLRALSSFWTASKVSRSIIGGTGTIMIPLTGFSSLVLERWLNSVSPRQGRRIRMGLKHEKAELGDTER